MPNCDEEMSDIVVVTEESDPAKIDQLAATLKGLGERYSFACTQNHHAIDQEQGIEEDATAGVEEQKRHIVRTATLADYQRDPDFVAHASEAPARSMTLYPNKAY